jgi:hypothetical protein
MKLIDWAERQRWELKYRHGGAVMIADQDLIDRPQAWRLEDYLVSAVTGGCIWFVRRASI